MRVRLFRPDDLPVLQEIHEEQNLGYPMPTLSHPLYFLKLVAENNVGTVLAGMAFRLSSEVIFMIKPEIGPKATGHILLTMTERARPLVLKAGMDEVHAFVPRKLRSFMPHMRRLGFQRTNKEFVPYFQRLASEVT